MWGLKIKLSSLSAIVKNCKILFSNKEFVVRLIFLGIIFSLVLINGLKSLKSSDFYVTNGSFQNYNIVRRILDGQAPFKDFAVYLGLGHALILSIPQFFFGNNFAAHLVISNCIVLLCFALFCYSISRIILKDSLKSVILTLMLCFFSILISLKPVFFEKIMNNTILNVFNLGTKIGNSALIIRLVIIAIMLILLPNLLEKRLLWLNDFNYKKETLIGLIAGMSILWSNDGGISWFLSFSLIYALLQIKYKGVSLKLLKSTILYIACSIVSLFIISFVVTRGNPLAYFEKMIGIGSYQKWFYEDLKPTSILEYNLNFYTGISIFLIVFFMIKFIRSKLNDSKMMTYFWISVTLFSLFIQTTTYFFSSGSSRNNGVMYLSVFIVLISYFLKQLLNQLIKHKFDENSQNSRLTLSYSWIFIVLSICLIVILPKTFLSHLSPRYNHSGQMFLQKLGWLNSPDPNQIKRTIDFLGNDKVFSTYASAVESLTEQFQPSGFDYIINVMGDKQRIKYMKSFNTDNFRYAVTIHPSIAWGDWIISANWFFHRELYMNYLPVFENGYQVYWERKNGQTNEGKKELAIKFEIIEISDSEIRIKVKTDTKENGILDTRIEHSLKFKQFFKNLDFQKSMTWNDLGVSAVRKSQDSNFRKNPGLNIGMNPSSNSNISYFPITLVNGSGTVLIRAVPKNNVKINIQKFEILNFFDKTDINLVTTDEIDFFLTDGNWDRGYSKFFVGFFVPNIDVCRQLYKIGNFIELSSSEKREIVKTTQYDLYLYVYLAGEVFDNKSLDIPTKLTIIQKE